MGFLKFFIGPDYVSFQSIVSQTIESMPDFKPFYFSCDIDSGQSLSEVLTTSFLFDNNKLIIANLSGISESAAKSFLAASDVFFLGFADKLPSKIVTILKRSGEYAQLPAVSLANLNSKLSLIASNLGVTLSPESRSFILSKKSTDLLKIYNALNQCKTGNILNPSPAHLKILLNSLEKETPPWELITYVKTQGELPPNTVVSSSDVFKLVGFFSKTMTQALNIKLTAFEKSVTTRDACNLLEIPSWQQKQCVPLANLKDSDFNIILDSFNEVIENIYSQYNTYYLTKFLVDLAHKV